ncbi:SDR family oxidoreductase [Veronia nyctiphanis]|uniref:SDR family oxidoreductase n=1 Tax=Veronia nyctiphanis TaxID=1278244 RepID=A0A4Q0YTR0_9GAMM|nr:SDR family NAD(P)-dependent oxidoreductase [Veronia nyctiphanis]RXJ74125.1 SDR family oxidoreductase [Veronia nyctiphanis]
MERKLVVITGYGPGLGEALKHRYQQSGYTVVGVARRGGDYQADTTRAEEVSAVFETIREEHGSPEIVIHNVATLSRGSFNDISAEEFEATWRASTLSAFNVAQTVLPSMERNHKGTLIFTGATASVKGGKGFSPFSSAKFALRGLAQSLAREYQPSGVHIAHVVLDGIIWSDVSLKRFPNLKIENALIPKDIAEAYFQLSQQPRSTWSHEIDLRPYSESF